MKTEVYRYEDYLYFFTACKFLNPMNTMFLHCQCSKEDFLTNILFFLCRTILEGMLHVKAHLLESVQRWWILMSKVVVSLITHAGCKLLIKMSLRFDVWVLAGVIILSSWPKLVSLTSDIGEINFSQGIGQCNLLSNP